MEPKYLIGAVIFVVFVSIFTAGFNYGMQQVVTQPQRSDITMVYLYNNTENACMFMNPIVDELARNYSVANVNTDVQPDLMHVYNTTMVPTLIVFRNGTEIGRFYSVEQPQEVVDVINA